MKVSFYWHQNPHGKYSLSPHMRETLINKIHVNFLGAYYTVTKHYSEHCACVKLISTLIILREGCMLGVLQRRERPGHLSCPYSWLLDSSGILAPYLFDIMLESNIYLQASICHIIAEGSVTLILQLIAVVSNFANIFKGLYT